MIKYTLYCSPGKNFVPGVHYLYVGAWLDMKPDRVILAHGLMTEYFRDFIRHSHQVLVFKDSRYHTISIESSYNDVYKKRLGNLEESQQFCGILKQATWNDSIFMGGLEV